LDIRQNRSPGVSRCQITGLRRVGHVVFGVTVVQVVTVVEGCRDAGIGSDPHRREHGVQLRLGAASQCQCRSRSQSNFLFAGAAQSARFSPCLSRPLPVFSASSPKQPAPYWPSHPLLATTPLPPLPPSRFLSSGHPGTTALSCPLPRLPPCPLAVVTWCLNSSSLNCATSTETLEWLSSLPVLMQESFWWEQCSDRHIISLFRHLHTPFSPSLISLMVSVDFEHRVYLPFLGSAYK